MLTRALQQRWLFLPALWVTTLVTYRPVWYGGLVWDDAGHLTRPGLRSLGGLWRIWFDLSGAQQYYPVVYSTFWVFHRLWGDETLGYHLVNISLHSISAFLVALILWRLRVPGAMLAATIFALHPIEVESVAWMSELKNTLSGVFYLAAALAYLRFDERRERWAYGLALLLFMVAMLSKTVTATLPAALLVVFWWQRGRLNWTRDVKPLLPFFAIAVVGGALTSWVEHSHVRASGHDFERTLIERTLTAGRAIWFYLGTLLWPTKLAFIYPKWDVHADDWRQYLYLFALLAGIALLWLIRRRTRAPLAVALLFCGTLLPALGFVDVYSFRYSFVADHFQYLAGIPVIVLFSAGVVGLVSALARSDVRAEPILMLAFGLPLALMSARQSRDYLDADRLFRATLERNPQCWMCHTNLAVSLLEEDAPDRLGEALEHLQASLRINPNNPETHNNMGGALQQVGRFKDAIAEHQLALRLDPQLWRAALALGVAHEQLGQLAEAAEAYRAALQVRPNDIGIRRRLDAVLEMLARQERARINAVSKAPERR